MRLYTFEITKVPAESRRWIGIWDGEDVYAYDPDWRPNGWVAYLDEMAADGHRWAKVAVMEDYKFFWPAEGKLYKSRSTAADKVRIVERWGGKARILEAEVGEFIPIQEANQRRKQQRAQARIDKLRAEIDRIRNESGLEVPF